jgi:hypothetical protein
MVRMTERQLKSLLSPTKAPPVQSERQIQRECLGYLQKTLGLLAWRNNSGGITVFRGGKKHVYRFNSAKGSSDIFAILPRLADGRRGVFLAVEVKRPGNEPTEQQAAFLEAVRASGGIAIVVTSLDGLIDALRREGYIP